MELATYQSHKRVKGFQIGVIYAQEKGTSDGTREELHYVDGILAPQKTEYVMTSAAGEYSVIVSDAYYKKHEPFIGGYYVRYENGYESFSPAEAFEDGYAKVASGFKWKTIIVWPEGTVFPEVYPDFEIHVENNSLPSSLRPIRGRSVSRVILRGDLAPADITEELQMTIHLSTRTYCHHHGAEIDWEVQP
jgi:hypothetical protein